MLKINLIFFGIVFIFMSIILFYNHRIVDTSFEKFDTGQLKALLVNNKVIKKRLVLKKKKLEKARENSSLKGNLKKVIDKVNKEIIEIDKIKVKINNELNNRTGGSKADYLLLIIGVFLLFFGVVLLFKDRKTR